MRDDRSFHEFVTQRQITELVMRRVAEHVYDRPLINNVERADYVECLVELIMQSADPRWRLTESWDPWDVEHPDGARIEVKQSSALQSWSRPSPTNTNPRFDISISEWYWVGCDQDDYHSVPTEGRRLADVYVFAWHEGSDRELVDHRDASQWEFFVVPESELPPSQRSISLNPLRRRTRPCSYRSLAQRVTSAIPRDDRLKSQLYAYPEPCPTCRPDGS